MSKATNLSLKVGACMTVVGIITFLIQAQGAQQAAYGLFLVTGLLYSFLIEERISGEIRDEGKGLFFMLKIMIKNILPPLIVMVQTALLLSMYSTYSHVLGHKDASGNMPGILKAYSGVSFTTVMFEMILLHIYTAKILRGGAHPNKVIKMAEKAMIPAFIGLGVLGFGFTSLLYMVITHYLTDG